jgi:hypothetical protein
MPLEISEIGVRLAVGAPAQGSAAPPAHGGPDGASVDLTPRQFEDIVRACVQEVLDALRLIEDR